MSVSFILLIISAICFILSAMGFPTQPAPYNTVALGLFFLALALLFGGMPLH